MFWRVCSSCVGSSHFRPLWIHGQYLISLFRVLYCVFILLSTSMRDLQHDISASPPSRSHAAPHVPHTNSRSVATAAPLPAHPSDTETAQIITVAAGTGSAPALARAHRSGTRTEDANALPRCEGVTNSPPSLALTLPRIPPIILAPLAQ